VRRKLPAWFTKNLFLGPAVIACGLTAASLWVGVAFRPTVSAPPLQRSSPSLTVDFSSQPPQSVAVTTVLTGDGDSQARLEIDVAGTFSAGQQTVGYALYVENFTGYDCTPKSRWVAPEDLGGGDYSFMHTVPVPANGGDSFTAIDLCWTTQSPLTANSSYLAAALPTVRVPSEAGTVTRTISLNGNGLAAYQLAGAVPPTSQGPQGWTWQDPIGNSPSDQTVNALLVSGTSIVGVQHASDDTFYSGIAYGVGFGGAIALLLALPDLWRKSQERREAKPGAKAEDAVKAGEPVESDDSVEAT